jgi:ATP synthase F1 gamma subunit
MPSIRQLNQDLAVTQSLLLITESLGEVAAIKFKSTHSRIEHNTAYFQEVAQVYQAIEMIAAHQRLKRKNKTAEPNHDRTVSILVTSNYQFYGDLDNQLTHYFVVNTSKYPTDRIVIGKTGQEVLEVMKYAQKYDRALFHSDAPKQTELAELVSKIRSYGKVLVYHSKFVTVLDQDVSISQLGAETGKAKNVASNIDYILEPELGKMLDFFENQIMASRLDALFLQAQLARTAARMIGMDQAQMNAEKQISKGKGTISKEKKKIQNRRILETYTELKALNEELLK